MEHRFSLSERFRSFRFAFNGIIDLIRNEHNFRIHLVILLIVVIAGILLRISTTDWLFILLVSAMVLISEGFNSSIEQLSDAVESGEDDRIKRTKDMAAAAVLISAIAAVIAGLIIFIPELLQLVA
jgi:diacylglycerol kinase